MSRNKNKKIALRSVTSLVNISNQLTITNKILKLIKKEQLVELSHFEDLIIEPTKKTPKVEFKSNGEFWIKGRLIPFESFMYFEPLFNWLHKCYLLNPAEKTSINIMLEYINTGCIKSMMVFLKDILQVHYEGLDVSINWYCEILDEDMKEIVEIISKSLQTRINLIEIDFNNF